jgi:hypothetical protein
MAVLQTHAFFQLVRYDNGIWKPSIVLNRYSIQNLFIPWVSSAFAQMGIAQS